MTWICILAFRADLVSNTTKSTGKWNASTLINTSLTIPLGIFTNLSAN